MPELNVLVVDDEPAIRQVLSSALSKAGYPVEAAASAAAAAPTAPVPSLCTVWVEAPPPCCAAGCVFGLGGDR